MNYPPQNRFVSAGEAKTTAAARGFRSVKEWMKENRHAAARHRTIAASSKDRNEKRKYRELADCLDREFDRFNPHA